MPGARPRSTALCDLRRRRRVVPAAAAAAGCPGAASLRPLSRYALAPCTGSAAAAAAPSRHPPPKPNAPAHAPIDTLWPAPAGLHADLAVALVAVKVLPLLHLLLAAHERLHHFGCLRLWVERGQVNDE